MYIGSPNRPDVTEIVESIKELQKEKKLPEGTVERAMATVYHTNLRNLASVTKEIPEFAQLEKSLSTSIRNAMQDNEIDQCEPYSDQELKEIFQSIFEKI